MSDAARFPGRLPPAPDFERIEAQAATTAGQRARVLQLVGDLNVAWANNESLLIYLIMLLMRCDEVSAAIVFATLNTTRARIDLAERLAKAHLRHEPEMRASLSDALDEFARLTRVRNDMNHCIFVVGPAGDLTHTQTLKLEERRGSLVFGARRLIDARRFRELDDAARRLKALNRRIWSLLPVLGAAMEKAPAA